MKPMLVIMLVILCYPLSLCAEGKITYSGVPCQWARPHELNFDEVGLQKDDPVTAREDRKIIASIKLWPSDPGIIERGDGRLLIIDPRLTQ